MSNNTPKLTRFRVTIQYDGTDFHGSQLQPEVRTVQGELEAALSGLADRRTRVDFAGRTDAGVHALGQETAFDLPARWEPDELGRALGAVLPEDIAPGLPRIVDAGFHPRFDADRRRYLYVVAPGTLGVSPFTRRTAWRSNAGGPGLDDGEETLATLDRLAALVSGERDFDSFAKRGQPERGTRCAVESAGWRRHGAGYLLFDITADRFLHHMVRYLVGTMVEIAAGRRPESDLEALLAGDTATRAVFPAPPGGLYLSAVRYPDGWNRAADLPW